MGKLEGKWEEALRPEFGKAYYRVLFQKVMEAYRTEIVYPPKEEIFTAFHLTPMEQVKVIIIGQDPYHEPGQAHGLSFSVKKGIQPPPSLVNIYKELQDDLHCPIPTHGDLSSWARQGVLLLNSCLTVRAHQAFSHSGIGWENFTDAAIQALEQEERAMVYILWGRPAREKKKLIHQPKHYVIESAHPSPLSAYRGFFGSRPFSKTNALLEANGLTPIDWEIK